MKLLRLAAIFASALLLIGACVAAAEAGKDQILLNQGKVLMFEKNGTKPISFSSG